MCSVYFFFTKKRSPSLFSHCQWKNKIIRKSAHNILNLYEKPNVCYLAVGSVSNTSRHNTAFIDIPTQHILFRCKITFSLFISQPWIGVCVCVFFRSLTLFARYKIHFFVLFINHVRVFSEKNAYKPSMYTFYEPKDDLRTNAKSFLLPLHYK